MRARITREPHRYDLRLGYLPEAKMRKCGHEDGSPEIIRPRLAGKEKYARVPIMRRDMGDALVAAGVASRENGVLVIDTDAWADWSRLAEEGLAAPGKDERQEIDPITMTSRRI